MQRSAYVEAVQHLTTGVEILGALPDTPGRARQELHMVIPLGEAVRLTQGETSLDYERVCVRAHALCQQLGDTPRLFEVLTGLRKYYEVRASSSGRASWRSRPSPDRAPPGSRPPRGSPLFARADLVLLGRDTRGAQPLRAAHCPLRAVAARVHGALPQLCGVHLVGARLSGPGPTADTRGAHGGAGVVRPSACIWPLDHAGHIHRLRREVYAVQERNEAAMARAAELGLARWWP